MELLKTVVAGPIQTLAPIVPLPTMSTLAPKMELSPISIVPPKAFTIVPIPKQAADLIMILLSGAARRMTPGAMAAPSSITTSPEIYTSVCVICLIEIGGTVIVPSP
jgi:hypothetical protein